MHHWAVTAKKAERGSATTRTASITARWPLDGVGISHDTTVRLTSSSAIKDQEGQTRVSSTSRRSTKTKHRTGELTRQNSHDAASQQDTLQIDTVPLTGAIVGKRKEGIFEVEFRKGLAEREKAHGVASERSVLPEKLHSSPGVFDEEEGEHLDSLFDVGWARRGRCRCRGLGACRLRHLL
jgi:hypothetical protein